MRLCLRPVNTELAESRGHGDDLELACAVFIQGLSAPFTAPRRNETSAIVSRESKPYDRVRFYRMNITKPLLPERSEDAPIER